MEYKFKSEIDEFDDCTIFKADNGIGFVKNKVLYVRNDNYEYCYEENEWKIKTPNTEAYYPCGQGAIPLLDLNNIIIENEILFDKIIYKLDEN